MERCNFMKRGLTIGKKLQIQKFTSQPKKKIAFYSVIQNVN